MPLVSQLWVCPHLLKQKFRQNKKVVRKRKKYFKSSPVVAIVLLNFDCVFQAQNAGKILSPTEKINWILFM